MPNHSDLFIEIPQDKCKKEAIPYQDTLNIDTKECDYCQVDLNAVEHYHEDFYLDNKKISVFRQCYYTCDCNGIWILVHKNANDTYTEVYRNPLDIANCHLEVSKLYLLNIDVDREIFLKSYLKNYPETKSDWEAYHRLYEKIVDLGNHIRIMAMLKTDYPLNKMDFNEFRFGLTISICTLLQYSGLHLWLLRKRQSFEQSITLICSIMDSQHSPISLKKFTKEYNIPELDNLNTNLNFNSGKYHDIKYLRDKQLEHNDSDFSWTQQQVTPELLIAAYSDIIIAVNELNKVKGIEVFFNNQLETEDESDVINFLIRELMIIEGSLKIYENNSNNNK